MKKMNFVFSSDAVKAFEDGVDLYYRFTEYDDEDDDCGRMVYRRLREAYRVAYEAEKDNLYLLEDSDWICAVPGASKGDAGVAGVTVNGIEMAAYEFLEMCIKVATLAHEVRRDQDFDWH